MIRRIWRKCLNYYDKLTAQTTSVSVADILLPQGGIEHNQFLSITRYIDIKNYCEMDDDNFSMQNMISKFAYGTRFDSEKYNILFKNLIESCNKNGFDSNSCLVVDKNGRLLDGNHRMGMLLFSKCDEVKVKVLKRKSKNPSNIDWYISKGVPENIIEEVVATYSIIVNQLLMKGNTFVSVVPKDADWKWMKHIVNIVSVYNFITPNVIWGGVLLSA